MPQGPDKIPEPKIYPEEELKARLDKLRAQIEHDIRDLRNEEVGHSSSIQVLEKILSSDEGLEGQLLNNFSNFLPGGFSRGFSAYQRSDEWRKVFEEIDRLIPELGFDMKEVESWQKVKYSQLDEVSKKKRRDLLLALFFRLEKKFPNLNLRG